MNYIDSLIDTINSHNSKLPICLNANNHNIVPELRNLFDDYINQVKTCIHGNSISLTKKLPPYWTYNSLIEMLETISNSLLNSIDHFHAGLPNKAYNRLAEGLSILLKNKSTRNNFREHFTLSLSHFKSYRLRNKLRPNDIINHPKDLFHIPFGIRRITKSYRYSIPGFPCLYLGSSPEISFKEIGESMKDLFGIVFESKKNLTFFNIDFSEVPYSIDIEKLYIKIVSWPLIAACSIKMNDSHKSYEFKPEYIIPQLLLQYIRQQEIGLYTQTQDINLDYIKDLIHLLKKNISSSPDYINKLIKELDSLQKIISEILCYKESVSNDDERSNKNKEYQLKALQKDLKKNLQTNLKLLKKDNSKNLYIQEEDDLMSKSKNEINRLISLLSYEFKENPINGIRYLSTHYDSNVSFNQENYVLPVLENKSEGYCSQLTNLFTVSPVVEIKQTTNPFKELCKQSNLSNLKIK
ncbi:hypothetical protein K5X82_15145 [Halosquirtibacter xylanolyticus]|uniref:hypothetical protein n=1 Tax=Halosquirtibacter xylanolyticus TaxID=3374599 RepID=UPI00374A30C6|nr:hypothetical protein K5X82_15145 [Prolixibacteraceae bacterium]